MSGDKTEQYACKCLNVRIIASPPLSAPPQYPRDPDYTPVFIKDDSITVIHPQVTVRVPLKGEPIPGTSRYSRFTVLTCLFCSLPIYRVHNTISPEVEGSESTLLPSEDWVEREIMKTSTGWIDVHKDSINGNKIPEILKSSSYISTFSVALTSTHSSPPSSQTGEEETSASRKPSPSPEAPQQEYLSDLRPLFLPPPFTSSHPIFVHLAGLASKESHELRAAAERRIADFVKAETAGLEVKETELKQQVEILWTSFRHNLDTVQRERPHVLSNIGRALSRSNPHSMASTAQPSSSVTIRDFAPQRVSSPQRHPNSSPAPRVSALSASLVTTKFHHPKEVQEQSSSRSSSSNGTMSSPQSISSTLVAPLTRGDGLSILQYPPKTNDTMNTEASYRYFLTLDEDMARYKEAQSQAQKKLQEAEAARHPQEAGPSGTHNTNGIRNPASSSEGPKPEVQASSSRPRDKAKKVVTFVEPVSVPTEDQGANDTEDPMIFPFEISDQPEEAGQSSISPQNTLPLVDQSVSRPRPRSARVQNNAAHDAFSSLRPSSLPAPSHIRPMRSQPGVDSFSQSMILNLPRVVSGNNRLGVQRDPLASSSTSRPVTENEAAVLKLVAADTPSHRGASTPESKAWREFTRRQNSKDSADDSNIPEDGESEAEVSVANAMGMSRVTANTAEDDVADSSTRGLPGSLPVNIVNRIKPREPLSLASYRPPTALSEDPAGTVHNVPLGPGNKPLSTTTIRKALYTERDRNRAMDPGALDFAIEEDEEDASEESEHEQVPSHEVGEQGRRNALKIIQARDELPSEGMWRSLA